MRDRAAKQALFDEFARVAKALSSGRRAEIIDVLANGPRTVESLAQEIGLSVANVSQHLQVLKRAGLVVARRDATSMHYSLARPEVFTLWRSLQSLAETSVAEIERLARAYLGTRDELEPVTAKELRRRLKEDGSVTVVDVRPRPEYEAGHIPGAVSIPITELHRRLKELPQDGEILAYCRGEYCVFSHEAVALLRKKGYNARRLQPGFPDWAAEGLPVASGVS